MKSPRKNPIAAVVQPLPGRQLPSDWKLQTNDFGGNFDRRDLSENMWRIRNGRQNFNDGNVESLTKDARLKPFNNSDKWNRTVLIGNYLGRK
jgi:hypothetical protein